jgi:hypothetical protein
MTTTEEQIVYQILNTVKNTELNNDEVISERLIRSYIHKYRADLLNKNYFFGMTIPDEVFQRISLNSFEIVSTTELKHELPPFISFEENFGLKMSKYGEFIPIINSEEFRTSIKTRYGKTQVKATVEQRKLKLYKGNLNCCIDDNSIQANLIKHFNNINPSAELEIILVNPDDDPTYKWTETPFPFPFELIQKLVQSILALEFNIILQTKADKIGDQNAKNTEE